LLHVVGQTGGDIFREPALHSELSQDNEDVDNGINDDAAAAAADDDDNIEIDDGKSEDDTEDIEAGCASGEDDNVVVESTLDSHEMLTVAQRQHSTTEYLPGMLHTNSPPGLLPKFPSWSILQLGEYSSYNPATGISYN